MQLVRHSLAPSTPGQNHELVSLHYGTPGAGEKATIQASLHADEIPGMLVAHHLRGILGELEAQGMIAGEVVLVPAANPLGLGQWSLRGFQGRFEVSTGENFNRHYPDLVGAVLSDVGAQLGPNPADNVKRVRAALRRAVEGLPALTTLASLRKTLLGLAIDADVVLDLHCDGEALLHFYTATALWPQGELLARCLGVEMALLADRSGDDPFDEACSMVWPQLAAKLPAQTPLPAACFAATIELRGEGDVRHDLAERDALAIISFLRARGIVHTAATAAAPELPALRCVAYPLSGSIPIVAPRGGMLVFVRAPGDRVTSGEHLADLIDPFTGEVTALNSPVDGLFFARENRRFAVAGMSVGKVAGREAVRHGKLLSA